MTEFLGPGAAVAVPPKAPPTYSLVKMARDPKDYPDHWELGIAYRPEPCSNVGIYDPCAGDTKKGGGGDDTRPDIVTFQAFGVYAYASCFTFSMARVRQLPTEAKRNLIACQSKQIAAEFMDGTFAQAKGWDNVYLRKAGTIPLSTLNGVDSVSALACLEQGLADAVCGRGMIHATPRVVTDWVAQHLIVSDGASMYTTLGTLVIPDSGYSGGPPATVAAKPGVSWAYATDMVDLRLSDISVVPDAADYNGSSDGWIAHATDRGTNEVVVRCERAAAVTFDGCCRIGVGVQTTTCLGIDQAS